MSGQHATGQNATGQNDPDKMSRDKMPATVECCFSLLLHALNEAANCLTRRKIELNIIAKFYSKYQTPTHYL